MIYSINRPDTYLCIWYIFLTFVNNKTHHIIILRLKTTREKETILKVFFCMLQKVHKKYITMTWNSMSNSTHLGTIWYKHFVWYTLLNPCWTQSSNWKFGFTQNSKIYWSWAPREDQWSSWGLFTWWWLFRVDVMHTGLDIYVFTTPNFIKRSSVVENFPKKLWHDKMIRCFIYV
jgi:hypothetical protein